MQFSYLGPLREKPARRYIYEDEISEIGAKGENAAYVLANSGNLIVDSFYINRNSSTIFVENKDARLNVAVETWMHEMGIKGFRYEKNNDLISIVMDSKSNSKVSMADVGFGVSQVFPVILEGLRIDSGDTLILEQPEIHLHPGLQMKIADYIISLALSGKGVIVETHSDHMINRMVRRIIEDETGELKNMIGIYFISSSDDGPIIERVQIDDKIGIKNWPSDFFDQAADEQEAILMAGIAKRKAAKVDR